MIEKNRKRKKDKIKKIRSNQKGMALLTTIIFVFVLVSLGVALLTMTNNDTKMSTLQRESNKAFYLADAGIEDTFWKLNTSTENGGMGTGWRESSYYPDDTGTASEYYQVKIEKIGVDADGEDIIKITSQGTVFGEEFSSGQRRIEVTAEIDYPLESMYDYAILSEKIILFQGTPGPDVVGDVHSNDDILVSGHFADTYTGLATCSGDTNDINSANTGAPKIDVPVVDYEELKTRALADEAASGEVHYHTGNISLGNGEVRNWTGIHFIEGSLEAKNGSEIHVTNGAIIATGDVDIKNGALFDIYNDDTYIDINDPITALALAAQGDIKIYAKSTIQKGVVQSVLADGTPEGYIELKNGCEVTGSIISDTVYLRNKSTVNYPASGINEMTKKGDPFFKKTSWREIY